jgi:hypothetical protein
VENISPQNLPHGEIWPPKIAGKSRNFPFFQVSYASSTAFLMKWWVEREKARQLPGFFLT